MASPSGRGFAAMHPAYLREVARRGALRTAQVHDMAKIGRTGGMVTATGRPPPLDPRRGNLIDGRYEARFKVLPGVTGAWQAHKSRIE